PWLNFTALSHARSFKNIDCCPKISVGQLQKKKRKYILPISIHVNHALVDGYHINLFFKALEDAISDHSHLLST
ncbi:MAG TPA: CatA-like O-acetyltransferase, partial [Saprospiraceae bacterium]|nr:CatA-like O-acetyltransferase [Saprospiraceae bacterium]